MNWKLKTLAFWAIDICPYGVGFYDFAQKRITKRYSRKYLPIQDSGKLFLENIEILKKYRADISGLKYYEFGAGRDLYSNILNYCFGMNSQVVVDITPLARRDSINGVILALQQNDVPGVVRKPPQLLGEDFTGDLKNIYGIEYRAPADARAIEMENGAFDVIVTTDTLEHIPLEDLRLIMQECYRLCDKDSIVVMQVDYSDHFAHTDSRINEYNFIQYGDKHWKLYNPPMHYQNRLRHSDYIELFNDAGFKIINEESYTPENARQNIKNIVRNSIFSSYKEDDLIKTRGKFVLGK